MMRAQITLPPEKYFYVNDGSVLKNMDELLQALLNMEEHTFSHHVNEHKHDFHTWIRDVFQDNLLAHSVKNVKEREVLAKKIFRRVYA